MAFEPDKLKEHKMKDLTLALGANAVLIPLIRDDNDETGWKVLFQVRAEGIGQAGEICFPGGRIEDNEDAADAAIRETSEELLISPKTIELLCPVVEQIGPKNRKVKSYVGILNDYKMTYSKDKVAKVFTLPLSWLMKHEPIRAEATYSLDLSNDFPYDLISGGKEYPFLKRSRTFWFYKTCEGNIWGITAEILNEFVRIVKSCY